MRSTGRCLRKTRLRMKRIRKQEYRPRNCGIIMNYLATDVYM